MSSIARRYARALFQIGVDGQSLDAFGRELNQLAQVYEESKELRQTLESPLFKTPEKRAVLTQVLTHVAPTGAVHSFALFLVERGRINVLPGIAVAFRQMVDDKMGRVRAHITSALPLDAASLTGIQRALEKRTGKRVMIDTAVDPALIGGVVARVGDLILDGSLRTRLANLSNRILN